MGPRVSHTPLPINPFPRSIFGHRATLDVLSVLSEWLSCFLPAPSPLQACPVPRHPPLTNTSPSTSSYVPLVGNVLCSAHHCWRSGPLDIPCNRPPWREAVPVPVSSHRVLVPCPVRNMVVSQRTSVGVGFLEAIGTQVPDLWPKLRVEIINRSIRCNRFVPLWVIALLYLHRGAFAFGDAVVSQSSPLGPWRTCSQ